MTDNTAVLDGYTREVVASGGMHELYLLVRPDTDFNSRFLAWDTDEQEFVRVSGWLFSVEDAESALGTHPEGFLLFGISARDANRYALAP
jgi:hypothetical protein